VVTTIDTIILPYRQFSFLFHGDVPLAPTHGYYISQLVHLPVFVEMAFLTSMNVISM